MEFIFDIIGYAVLFIAIAGILYLFYKILASGLKALSNNDD